MKIVFVAAFLNSHLLALAESLNQTSDFHFIVTEPHIPEDWNAFGRGALSTDYVVQYFEESQKEYCRELVRDCDFAIFASNSAELLHTRLEKGGLSFFYSERFFKKGRLRGLHPKHIRSIYHNVIQYSKRKDFHVLCASAFLPYDLTLYGFDVSKCRRWGYFPAVGQYDNLADILDKKEPHSILWCGRMLKLKHPEAAVKLAKKLKENGYSFHLTFVGDGPVKKTTEDLVCRWNLQDCITFAGHKTQEEVRKYMEKREIFLFTSNRKEGWGAVMNESMGSGCAVVASSAIGSVPFLIKDGENGRIYRDGNINDLYKKVSSLLDSPESRKNMQENAYRTITETWSSKNAARNLVQLAQTLRDGKTPPTLEGPCSPAPVLKDGWYKGE